MGIQFYFLMLHPFFIINCFISKAVHDMTTTYAILVLDRGRNAKQFENSNSDPIGHGNRAAAIEKWVIVDISTRAHFCMQDTIEN